MDMRLKKLVLGEGDENKICELGINYKQAAEFIRIFISVFKGLDLIGCNQTALHKFIEVRSKVMPGRSMQFGLQQQRSDGLRLFTYGEYGKFKTRRTDLIGRFF